MKRFFYLLCLMALTGPVFATELRLSVSPEDKGLRDRLRAASLVAAQLDSSSVTGADLMAAARADYARLVSVLYAQGYFGPQVSIRADGKEVTTIPAFGAPAQIDLISVVVLLGPDFTFGRAAIAPVTSTTEVPQSYATGQPARTKAIRDAAKAGIDGWRAEGHAKARVSDQSIVADHNTNLLHSALTLEPGPRLRFGSVATTGKSAVRADRIREIAGVPEGEVFSPGKLERSAERLRQTGAFRSVSITEVDGIGPANTQDIEITVSDQKPRRIGAGAELSSFEGVTLSGLWMHRNLLGGAERLRLEAQVGGIAGNSGGEDYSLSARFDRPATFTPDTSLYLAASVEDFSEPEYDERRAVIEGGLSHWYSDQLQVEMGARLLTAEYTDGLGMRSSSLLMLPASAVWDLRDDSMNPSRGTYLDLGLAPMIGLDQGDIGLRAMVDGRWYHGFGADARHVAAMRLLAGSVFGLGQADIPPSFLFFSGGGGTVRGQPYQSLGVDLGGGNQMGGRAFLGLSAELRLAVSDKIGVVGFADFGLVGDDAFGGTTQSHAGAGLGLRYDTGIGPIRFDVAAPVSGQTGDGVQLYIGLGQAF